MYIYTITEYRNGQRVQDSERHAYTNLNICKQDLSAEFEYNCMDRDRRTIEIEPYSFAHRSTYRWNNRGEYTRDELERLKQRAEIHDFARISAKLYANIDGEWIKETYECEITRYKVL